MSEPLGRFPTTRLRRLRRTPALRALVAENRLTAANLILPLFVIEGKDREQPVTTMPGVRRQSIDRLAAIAREAMQLGICALALFPVEEPDHRSPDGARATDPENLVCRAVRALKQAVPEIALITDVALDPYTSHGHDGLLIEGRIDNDSTLDILCRQALNQTEAGCDIVAPSDMMDGRIGRIRAALDRAGHPDTAILAYAAKYASAFYGPFRDAVNSGERLIGDKRSYQMDPANSDEAIHEAGLDLAEGADMIMVKPGLPYLDILARLKSTFHRPTLAYQVSGEYAMIRAAGAAGMLDDEAAMLESLLAFRRAGADAILTYAALEVARQLAD